jgi:hypothetical protein
VSGTPSARCGVVPLSWTPWLCGGCW